MCVIHSVLHVRGEGERGVYGHSNPHPHRKHSHTHAHAPTLPRTTHPPSHAGGELFDRLYKLDHLPEAEAAYYLAQLASFLAHTHARNIVHR